MKNSFKIHMLVVLALGILTGCSENKNPLPSKTHPESWMDANSENFHGKKVTTVSYDYCASCHGKDFRGGESKVSCFKCHTQYPHLQDFTPTPEPGTIFHEEFVDAKNLDIKPCQACHGNDYKGGSSSVSCYKCHDNFPHVENWLNLQSSEFHGQYLKSAGWSAASCIGCHGVDYKGGQSKVSCYACHDGYPHIEGWTESSSDAFHGAFLADANWELTKCITCHGNDYQGGSSEVSCFTCHSSFPHSDNWLNTTSDDFHGQYLKNASWLLTDCQRCHGADFSGGKSRVSCFTCHDSYPHSDGWLQSSSDDFHGKFLEQKNWNLNSCTTCHGADYQGGTVGVSCYTCHSSFPHSNDWLNTTSDEFHGQYLKDANWSLTGCQLCHGTDYAGGNSKVSCYTCHPVFPHAQGWLDVSNDNFHGQSIRAANWSLSACKTCHGEDYRGGDTGVSCYLCHPSEGGPEACNTCHGSSANAAPPEDLSKNTETTAMGVGAHQKHYALFNSCSICHQEPSAVSDPGHIDNTPHAEVNESWAWDRTTATCVTGCHGDPNETYIWNNFED